MHTVEQDRKDGYRPTVAILLQCNGLILLGREAGGFSWHKGLDENDQIIVDLEEQYYKFGWKFPQGGIEQDETAETAFSREIQEELRPRQEKWEWLSEISEPEFFHHERLDFPVTKDGVHYRGKSYYYYRATVEWYGESYDNWVYGPNGDDGPYTSFAAGQFRGGVFFSSYITAQKLIGGLHQGRASSQALRVVHKLHEKGFLAKSGDGFHLSKDGDLTVPAAIPRCMSPEASKAWWSKPHPAEVVPKAALFGFHF